MIVASIDIGTNTILLLIAELNLYSKQLIPIYEEQQMPRLGKGLKPNGEITNEKIDLLVKTIAGYQKIIESYNCEKVIISGTNALRIAKNSADIIQLVKEGFDYSINIISGDEEAEYAYLGATSGISDFGTALIIDVGGGSTELIYGSQNEIIYKNSFTIGSVSATESFLNQTPPSMEEIKNLRIELRKIFNEIDKKFSPDLVVGIAGTATTLACMIKGLKEFDRKIVDNSLISRKELDELIMKIELLKPQEILSEYGTILNGREDIITGGGIILDELVSIIQTNSLLISSRGIRYGAIISEMFLNN
jgi:exopolyphosphatase/guanosine-5'-triphosphate,3'-diphosphate pyrophosphatase